MEIFARGTWKYDPAAGWTERTQLAPDAQEQIELNAELLDAKITAPAALPHADWVSQAIVLVNKARPPAGEMTALKLHKCPQQVSASKRSAGGSKKPFHPDQTEVQIDVIFAKTLYPEWVARGALEVEQAVEIPLDDDVAKIDRDRANQTKFLFIPKRGGNITDPGLQHIRSANFETRSAGAAMDRVEVGRDWMAVFTKRANYYVSAAQSPRAVFRTCRPEQPFGFKVHHAFARSGVERPSPSGLRRKITFSIDIEAKSDIKNLIAPVPFASHYNRKRKPFWAEFIHLPAR